MKRQFRLVLRDRGGRAGVMILAFVLAVALVGPIVSPHSITYLGGAPGEGPSSHALLGTDELGRDVLSRTLHGGLTVIGIASLATLLAYLVGIAVGLVAGYRRGLLDAFLMRGVDVLLAFPALLILLLLATGLGGGVGILILGIVLVQIPGISRVVRTAALEVSVRGYVEAAVVRGEGMASVLRREVLPNLIEVVLADFGIRFGYSVILMASVNYLNLGVNPPTADWALMMSENQSFISLNAWGIAAPAILLALLTVSANLIGDSYVRTLGRSSAGATRTRWRRRRAEGSDRIAHDAG